MNSVNFVKHLKTVINHHHKEVYNSTWRSNRKLHLRHKYSIYHTDPGTLWHLIQTESVIQNELPVPG